MDGSVACVARRLASSAFRRQVSLSDDIRGGSSNAPNQAASRCVGSSGHDRRAQQVVAKSPARRGITHTVGRGACCSVKSGSDKKGPAETGPSLLEYSAE